MSKKPRRIGIPVVCNGPQTGTGDVIDIAPSIGLRRKSSADGDVPRPQIESALPTDPLTRLSSISSPHWRQLQNHAIEPNGYYLLDWALAVNASARGRAHAFSLSAWRDGADAQDMTTLIGLMPTITLWRAYRLPLPALVTADPYGTLCTPLLHRDMADDAVARLMQQARSAGAHALILRDVALDGLAYATFVTALTRMGMSPRVLQSHARACLDAARDADDLLREALGAKKLKELRRQRHRLAEHGAVTFEVARSAADVAVALETFLALEASGWKAKRGTALVQHDGDASFIRQAAVGLAAHGQCEIVTLRAGADAVAAGIVLRHQDRAFFFKLGIDERFAKLSPGVQLTLDLTRHLCADPDIALVDSTAAPGHPMIGPIWRGRLAIGDVLIPLRRNDPVVTLISSVMRLRTSIRGPLRRLVQFIRKRQEKPT